MHTMDELNDKLLSELKNISEELEIKGVSKLSKQDLIYKILDEQAIAKPKKVSKKEPLKEKATKTFSKTKDTKARDTKARDTKKSQRNFLRPIGVILALVNLLIEIRVWDQDFREKSI